MATSTSASTAPSELKGFVEREREKGIFLSVLGFGQGNYRDEMAQALAQNGNGVAAYIDTLNEARKVLVQRGHGLAVHHRQGREAAGGVQPGDRGRIPARGLRDPRAQARGFQQRQVDAGDVGSGHTVTAIYEITPVGSAARMIDETPLFGRRQSEAG